MTSYNCPICQKKCATEHGLKRHQETHQKPNKRKKEESVKPSSSTVPTKRQRKIPETFRCRRCLESFSNKKELHRHGLRHHYQRGTGLQQTPWGNGAAPWMGEQVDKKLREEYQVNEPLILETHRPGPNVSIYNFPVDNTVDMTTLARNIDVIYQEQQQAFKLNFSFGVILQNRDTGEYRYFRPYANTAVLDVPMTISSRSDLQRLYDRLRRMDVFTELLRIRPDTKWIPVLVTNVRCEVYHTHYPLGVGRLPDYVRNNSALHSLDVDRHTGKPYHDHLCAFRCLALHKGHDVKSLEHATREFFGRWQTHRGGSKPFKGLTFVEFPDYEDVFRVNVEVYKLDESAQAWSVYQSRGRYEESMYLNLHEHHLSYVKDFAVYAKKFRCRTCDRHFDRVFNLKRHQRICTNKTKYVYPGGFFKPPQTIFHKLADYGIVVPESQRTFPWFIVFDFEAMLTKSQERNSEKLQWTQKHVPISVSVCSNVPDYDQPRCFVDDDLNGLVESMIAYMEDVAETAATLAEEKWQWVETKLQKMINEAEDVVLDEDETVSDDETETDEEEKNPLKQSLLKLFGQLKGYTSQVPVLGFNSARYDLNLIKQKLPRHLNMHDADGTFVVKRNNEYTCISSSTLKFLDIMQFLAPGTSYAKFLKAYGIEEQKGFFPYEWLDDVRKLDHRELPPHDAFYSSLKGSNISDEEYARCQKVWEERNMKTFRDFLEWYNNLDVGPFVKAVERLQEFYFDRGIDVLKTAISIPGIARQMLFKTAREAGANFSLFDKQNEDLYHTFKNNVVGGPSIIFTRHHKVNETYIRNDKSKPCKKIVGFDANALYLWAIDQKMPVGPFVRRLADNDFRPEIRDRYMAAYHWMDWLNHTGQASISHKLNNGEEKRVGKYPVDGWDANTNTVYQFHGCYFHGHRCDVTQNVKDPKWIESCQRKLRNTQSITRYLKSTGHKVVEMWECEFKTYCKKHRQIYDLIDSSRPGYFQHHKGKVTEEDILRGIRSGSLFGAVEVDIRVPEEWSEEFRDKMTLSPYDYFAEMSPLFCTTDVPFEAIGEHMQRHVEAFDLSKHPRRLLVGGVMAERMLIASPLLKWYLEHGMQVTKIHQVVEFLDQACFRNFVRLVSDARRAGDAKPETAIIADTMKVIGNSGYGSLIMDKTKHREIKYVQGESETCLQVNDPRFRKLECLESEEQYYEIEMAKKKIKLDLPIQLGYFILQYAKLRMLEFYYDFMDVYVGRQDFEYCEMDTDSAYMAITANSFDDVIKPNMRADYQRGLRGFCDDREVKADSTFHWFPRACCKDHARYDKRTPGLFKTEYEGDELIGLCSKTYIIRKSRIVTPTSTSIIAHRLLRKAKRLKPTRLRRSYKTTNEYKFSCKGINKSALNCPMTTFRHVLETGVPSSGINRGFRAKNNTIFTYVQERKGFSYFYCKRKVLSDGIHTEPLDVVLRPDHTTQEVDDRRVLDDLVSLLEENERRTTVVNISASSLREKGYRDLREWMSDPAHVYIGRECRYVPGARRSPWHNPFPLAKYSRDECLRLYENYVRNSNLYDDLDSLRGKRLGCWCHPEPCHGDILVSLLEEIN